MFFEISIGILNALFEKKLPCQCAVGLGLKMAILHVENWAILQKDTPPTQAEGGSGDAAKGVVQLQCNSTVGWVGTVCRQALSSARQAADVLVVSKTTLIDPSVFIMLFFLVYFELILMCSKIQAEVCPTLTKKQLLSLLEAYTPDEFDPEPIHPGVLKSIGESMHLPNSKCSLAKKREQ